MNTVDIQTALLNMDLSAFSTIKDKINEFYSTAGMLAVQHVQTLARENVKLLEEERSAGLERHEDVYRKMLASALDDAEQFWAIEMLSAKKRGIEIADSFFFVKFVVLFARMVETQARPTLLEAWCAFTSKPGTRQYIENLMNEEDYAV